MIQRDKLAVETKELLRAITIFKCLKYEQMCKLLTCKEEIADKILKNMIKQHRIYKDMKRDVVTVDEQSTTIPNTTIINAFWVFLEFNNKSEYYDIGEYPSIITFFANGEQYEIIYAAAGNEVTANYAMSRSEGESKKLVMVDDCKQINKLEVPNLLCFCTVSLYGEVEFFNIE